MLSLYAKHAAAVLDMATALDESAQRNEQVELAALAGARRSAQAGTSEEVAERLAVSIPDVVDCDGLSVWLWDEEQGALRALAAWARVPEQAEFLRGLSIGREDTTQLERLINEPAATVLRSRRERSVHRRPDRAARSGRARRGPDRGPQRVPRRTLRIGHRACRAPARRSGADGAPDRRGRARRARDPERAPGGSAAPRGQPRRADGAAEPHRLQAADRCRDEPCGHR